MYVDWYCNSYIYKLCGTRKIPRKIYLRILSSLCNNLCNIKIRFVQYMGHDILFAFTIGSIIALLFIIPLILIERNVIKTSKAMKSFFEDELKLSFHVPYKNSKDGSIIIFSRSNGFTKGGTIEAFKYVPWKSSELVQYNKKEMKELVKDL